LDACLNIAEATWTNPIWCRLLYVCDPKVDETFETESGVKRRTFPVISEIFPNEAAARAAAAQEGETAEAESTSNGSKPPLPAAYLAAGLPEEMFLGMFNKYIGEGADDSTIASRMNITDTESAAWREFVAA
jgi:hypothetical protein